MTAIQTDLQKRAIHIMEYAKFIEKNTILAPFSTKIKASAMLIRSPFTSVSAAKSYNGDCKYPIGTQALGYNSMTLDRNIGLSLTDCKEELSYAHEHINAVEMWKRNLFAAIMTKYNTVAVADVLGSATNNAVATPLGTNDDVVSFLLSVRSYANNVVGINSSISGGQIVQCEYHEKPFVACGSTAFNKIATRVTLMTTQSSTDALAGRIMKTPFGVYVVDLGESADNPNRLIYGVGGVPTIAFRTDADITDGISFDMGELTSLSTQTGAADLDIALNDPLLVKTWYIAAKTKGKNGIFGNVASLVTKGLAA